MPLEKMIMKCIKSADRIAEIADELVYDGFDAIESCQGQYNDDDETGKILKQRREADKANLKQQLKEEKRALKAPLIEVLRELVTEFDRVQDLLSNSEGLPYRCICWIWHHWIQY
jgi:hypothetical protein